MINHDKRFSKIQCIVGGKIHVYDRFENRYLCDKNNTNPYGMRVRTFTKKAMLEELKKPYKHCRKCIELLKTRKYKKEKINYE